MSNVIVLFEVTIKDVKLENYLIQVVSLKNILSKANTFIGAERFLSLTVDGKILSKFE